MREPMQSRFPSGLSKTAKPSECALMGLRWELTLSFIVDNQIGGSGLEK